MRMAGRSAAARGSALRHVMFSPLWFHLPCSWAHWVMCWALSMCMSPSYEPLVVYMSKTLVHARGGSPCRL
jgi:hypothetical protein